MAADTSQCLEGLCLPEPARLVPALPHKSAQAAAAGHSIRCVSLEGLEETPAVGQRPWQRHQPHEETGMFIKQGWSTCIPPKSRKALWVLVPAGKAKLGRQLSARQLPHSGSSTKSLPGALALGSPCFPRALLTQLSQAAGKVVSWFHG